MNQLVFMLGFLKFKDHLRYHLQDMTFVNVINVLFYYNKIIHWAILLLNDYNRTKF